VNVKIPNLNVVQMVKLIKKTKPEQIVDVKLLNMDAAQLIPKSHVKIKNVQLVKENVHVTKKMESNVA
jgi:ribosomal protein L20A (L18A)